MPKKTVAINDDVPSKHFISLLTRYYTGKLHTIFYDFPLISYPITKTDLSQCALAVCKSINICDFVDELLKVCISISILLLSIISDVFQQLFLLLCSLVLTCIVMRLFHIFADLRQQNQIYCRSWFSCGQTGRSIYATERILILLACCG